MAFDKRKNETVEGYLHFWCAFFVCLEDYKIVVIAGDSCEICFFRFPSMKFERKIWLMNDGVHHFFAMQGKDMIGVADGRGRFIEFIKLH